MSFIDTKFFYLSAVFIPQGKLKIIIDLFLKINNLLFKNIFKNKWK
jgi:hypothetical protein